MLVCALAWALTLMYSHAMQAMDSMNSMDGEAEAWTVARFAAVFAMWLAMMVAMMLPATFPMVDTFTAINRRRRDREAPYVATAFFVAGYLVAWAAFSVLAALVQWGLQSAGLLNEMMESASTLFSGVLFLAAGLYQFTPLKDVCLHRCRTPVGFVLTEWRDGPLGAIIMGLRHGLYCVGCCAALMLLLFAVAVMNLLWVAALCVLVMAEKLLPGGRILRYLIGAGLIAAGIVLLI